jgi:hypothetical protein
VAIDPMLYQKLSGRKGDPHTRLGEVLAKDAKAKQERDAMPKGVSGGMRTIGKPGMFMQLYYWFKDRARSKG